MTIPGILKKCLDRYAKKNDFCVHQFSKTNKIPYSTLYAPLYDGRIPRADTFLKILTALDALEVTSEKITINLK